jgi:hypothetical protein
VSGCRRRARWQPLAHDREPPGQKMPFMRQRTMTREINRPTPENSAIETNWALSELCKADEETSTLFGMTALQFSLVKKLPCFECLAMTTDVQCALPAQRQSAAGCGPAGRQ